MRVPPGGVIRFNCERELNHAVQIVGYDMTGSVPYYIVRNSWGPEFGLSGYLHVAIGGDLCGGWRLRHSVDAARTLRPATILLLNVWLRCFYYMTNDSVMLCNGSTVSTVELLCIFE